MSNTVQWLASQPLVEGALRSLAASPGVQALFVTALGQQEQPPSPVAVLWVLIALATTLLLFFALVPKARLAMWATCYFWLSWDKKTRKPDDLALNAKSPSCKRVKVIFIRHGESEWNAVFNKGSKITMPFRLARALLSEAVMLFEQDSLFVDSPLSAVGIQQGWDLLTFIASQPAGCLEPGMASRPAQELEVVDLVSILRGDAGESVVVSSILRRAISTGLLCLSGPRLLKTSAQKDKVVLMTHLQEISRNVDTLSLTPAYTLPQVPAGEAAMQNMGDLMAHFYRTRLDKKLNSGNKTLKQKAVKRQEQFTKWAFEQKTDCIIVCGHSIWFREFFKSYLPKASRHEAKTSKMVNCGCVAFDLYKDSQVVRIVPESIKTIYGGFETKGKKKA